MVRPDTGAAKPRDGRVQLDIRNALLREYGMLDARPFFHRVESLRGIGAVIVAAWHVSGWNMNGVQLLPHFPWPAAGWLQNAVGRFELALLPGHSALMVFFVISGFVLRVSLQYGPQDIARAAVRFHVARIFRIYPVVMLSILLMAIAYDWQIPATAEQPAAALSVSAFVANLLLLDVSLNSVLWAIQVEVLMAPVIVALYFVERWRGPWVLLGIAVVTSALSFHGGWTPWRPLSHNFFAFVLGMLVPTLGCKLVQKQSLSTVRWLLLGVVLSLYLTGPVLGFFSRFSAFFEGYLAFLLVSIVAYRTDLRSLGILDLKPIRLLGLSSGSYYVLHMALLVWIMPVIVMTMPRALSLHVPALAGPVAIAVAAAALALPALLSYYAVEAPGIALGRRVNAGWQGGRTRADRESAAPRNALPDQKSVGPNS
jgi:peptidoglycan/LPS O-acetylase OafA/YrhL